MSKICPKDAKDNCSIRARPHAQVRSNARRYLIGLLWARQLSEAGFLNRVLWEAKVITVDDYQFLKDTLSLAKEIQVLDVSLN